MSVLGPFAPLLVGGESQAIAASDQGFVTLNRFSAAWWEDGVAVTAELPGVPVDGTRLADGAVLVGPGRLSLRTRTWTADPGFAAIFRQVRALATVRAVAWSADGSHAAALIEPPREGRRPPAVIEVLEVAGGRVRARVEAPGAQAVVLAGERLVVGGDGIQVRDLDGAPIADLAVGRVHRLRATGSEVGVLGVDGVFRWVDLDREVVATWAGPHLVDVAVGRWIVGVDRAGVVHVGERVGTEVRTLSSVDAGVGAGSVALAGDRVVVAGPRGTRVAVLGGGG